MDDDHVLAGQEAQALLPADAYVPGRQVWHVAALLAPSKDELVPAAHRVQAVLLPAVQVPIGQ